MLETSIPLSSYRSAQSGSSLCQIAVRLPKLKPPHSGLHFVGVDPDDIADAEGPGGEAELLLFVITVSEQPAQQLLRVFACVSDLHVLV